MKAHTPPQKLCWPEQDTCRDTSTDGSVDITHRDQSINVLHRGIGLGLVKRFLQRENTVVATTRKPAEAEALQQLAQQQQGKGKLLIKLLDTSCEASVTAWASALAKEVSHVDVSDRAMLDSLQQTCCMLMRLLYPPCIENMFMPA